ncbi:MAG: hypothetical protein ACXACA_04730 [Candidatus Ranarchaeia archaeon]|jgi:hypothetical protein
MEHNDSLPNRYKSEDNDLLDKKTLTSKTVSRTKIFFVEYWHHFFGLSRLLRDKGVEWKEIASTLMRSPLVRKMWEGLHNEPGPTQAKVAIQIIETLYPGSKIIHEGRTIRIGCPANNSILIENAEAFGFSQDDVCQMCKTMYSTYAEEVKAAFSYNDDKKNCQVTFG